MSLTPTCVWRTTNELIVRLDAQLGEPLDTYVNGSQVWLREDGPAGEVLEWRLHPVPGYVRPKGVATHEVFERTALALATGGPPPAPAAELWDGLEVFPAYGDDLEPATVLAAAVAVLELAPEAFGLVDHEPIAEAWERSNRRTSIIGDLLAALTS